MKTLDFFPGVRIVIDHQRLVEAVLEYVENLADKPSELIPKDLLRDALMRETLPKALAIASRNLMKESGTKREEIAEQIASRLAMRLSSFVESKHVVNFAFMQYYIILRLLEYDPEAAKLITSEFRKILNGDEAMTAADSCFTP